MIALEYLHWRLFFCYNSFYYYTLGICDSVQILAFETKINFTVFYTKFHAPIFLAKSTKQYLKFLVSKKRKILPNCKILLVLLADLVAL